MIGVRRSSRRRQPPRRLVLNMNDKIERYSYERKEIKDEIYHVSNSPPSTAFSTSDKSFFDDSSPTEGEASEEDFVPEASEDEDEVGGCVVETGYGMYSSSGAMSPQAEGKDMVG